MGGIASRGGLSLVVASSPKVPIGSGRSSRWRQLRSGLHTERRTLLRVEAVPAAIHVVTAYRVSHSLQPSSPVLVLVACSMIFQKMICVVFQGSPPFNVRASTHPKRLTGIVLKDSGVGFIVASTSPKRVSPPEHQRCAISTGILDIAFSAHPPLVIFTRCVVIILRCAVSTLIERPEAKKLLKQSNENNQQRI